MLGKTSADMFKGEAKLMPRAILGKMAEHSLDFWFTSEDLSLQFGVQPDLDYHCQCPARWGAFTGTTQMNGIWEQQQWSARKES